MTVIIEIIELKDGDLGVKFDLSNASLKEKLKARELAKSRILDDCYHDDDVCIETEFIDQADFNYWLADRKTIVYCGNTFYYDDQILVGVKGYTRQISPTTREILPLNKPLSEYSKRVGDIK